ncbi:nucleoside transporter-domain-containing protein [Coniella lustricola]|uniref:Nucleoside transporter-domain-containing protein n=1 Tax=Coniella lustricola TaxID=2025994 RepID=A0A2T2ZSV0_9PEZI|nr:nucleoside transporter-domain-containing protein [Coniella lustricola]
MDRLRGILTGRPGSRDARQPNSAEYAPLHASRDHDAIEAGARARGGDDDSSDTGGLKSAEARCSWFEYTIFALLGVAMLWAWNMFLAAAPYFASRFSSRPSIADNFQSAILTVSTIVNLALTVLLTQLQRGANYVNRIQLALLLNTVAFTLLAFSTAAFRDIAPEAYLAFLLVDVFLAAMASSLFQNGAFAFAASFGRAEYTQAIMTGQGLAGVLPALAQMISVLVAPPPRSPAENGSGGVGSGGESDSEDDPLGAAAFLYFLTAVVMSVVTFLLFVPVARRHNQKQRINITTNSALDDTETETDADGFQPPSPIRKVVPLTTLFRDLHWLAGAVAICFVATIAFFPVFTTKILSVHPYAPTPDHNSNRIFDPAVFIPLAFLCWNTGDLLGRLSTSGRFNARLRRRPLSLFLIGLARFAALPLYLLCNLHGQGAVVSSDLFYLFVVQLPFGMSNGWLASNAMMAAAESVEEQQEESGQEDSGKREAAGGFMALCLVVGLMLGSFLSFSVAGL